MKRLLLNGSPRGKSSNSRLILSWIASGLAEGGAGTEIPVLDLARAADVEAQVAAVLDADEVILAFPLYTDSSPAVVKHFLERMAKAGKARLAGKRFGFVVQSGFPESIHSENTAAWLSRVCGRLGMVHLGTAVRGNSEGLRLMPERMTAKASEQFRALGRALAEEKPFPAEVLARIAGARSLSKPMLVLLAVMDALGIGNLYWDMMLRKHGAWERRFDAPYGPAADPREA